jgi:hypothetical protein
MMLGSRRVSLVLGFCCAIQLQACKFAPGVSGTQRLGFNSSEVTIGNRPGAVDQTQIPGLIDGPSRDSCSYYLGEEKKRQCLHNPQGGTTYLTYFGYNYCNKFLFSDLDKQSPEMSYFLVNVRFCLQEELSKFSATGTCPQLEDFAFNSHLGCYVSAKFCDLGLWGKVSVIGEIIGVEAIPVLARSTELLIDIEKTCHSNMLEPMLQVFRQFSARVDSLTVADMRNLSKVVNHAPRDQASYEDYFNGLHNRLGGGPGQAESGLGLTEPTSQLTQEEFSRVIAAFATSPMAK